MWPYSETETLDIVRQISLEVDSESGEPTFLSKGSNNEVFFVPGSQAPFVVRVCGDWREIRTRRESWCYERSRELGIPGPDVIKLGKREKLPYLALSFVEGVSGTAFGDSATLWETLGKYGAAINGIPFEVQGEELFDPESRWCENAIACLEPGRLALVAGLAGWTDEVAFQVRSRVTSFLEGGLRIGLSHGDLDPRNTIVGDEGMIYLIDWCCSRRGPIPHVDLYNILRETDPRGSDFMSYLKGYGMSRDEFESIEHEIVAFGLVELMSPLFWATEARPDLVEEYANNLVRYLKRECCRLK